jgi:hypothetical protein
VAFLLGVFDLVFDMGLKEFILGVTSETPLEVPVNPDGSPFDINSTSTATPETPEDLNSLGTTPEELPE